MYIVTTPQNHNPIALAALTHPGPKELYSLDSGQLFSLTLTPDLCKERPLYLIVTGLSNLAHNHGHTRLVTIHKRCNIFPRVSLNFRHTIALIFVITWPLSMATVRSG